jgi:deoxynucleoside triphosphate triphosphohydrolase SAMHD1
VFVSSLNEIQNFAESFASAKLDSYIASLKKTSTKTGKKEINDPLWGSIALTELEILIVDSPLVQRLRYIKQLGVIHWVYPGAVHSRFEHTLGVLHQVQNLINALNSIAIAQGSGRIVNDEYRHLLRVCAVLHDVGHAAFSHVSESALQRLPAFEVIAAEFAKQHKVENKSLSEIVAFYIIQSSAVRNMLEYLLDRFSNLMRFDTDRTKNINAVIRKISDAIIGKKIDDKVPLLHELISGPFDADKLDYFVRDAMMAGTPSVVDISRLIQKISIRSVEPINLPDEIARSVQAIEGNYSLFGIKWSGVSVLDELHLARVLLYAKIYRHTKVIAIEQMLSGVVRALAMSVEPLKILSFLYNYDDDLLLAMNAEQLSVAIGVNYDSLDSTHKQHIDVACRVLRSVRERRLSVKAFQLQLRYPQDLLEKDEIQSSGLKDMREELAHPQQCELFRRQITEEVKKLLKIIQIDDFNDAYVDATILVHHLGQTPGGTQIERAYLMPASGRPIPFREYVVSRNAWAAAYMSDQPVGFVFAPSELADLTFIAVEKLVRIKYGVKLPASALEASKRRSSVIQDLKRCLGESDFYKDVPFDLRPEPERLGRADIRLIVETFTQQLHKYQRPEDGTSQSIQLKTAGQHVHSWLAQFQTDSNVECALRVLKRFRMIERSDTIAAIRKFIEQNPLFKGATVVAFGDAKDSGAIQTYFAGDLIHDAITRCATLEEAAKNNWSPVIFIDDFVASGGQGQDILGRGFGVDSLTRDLDEQRALFDTEVKQFLKKAHIGFVFTAAWNAGLEAIREATEQLELNAVVYGHICEDEIPFLDTSMFEGIDKDDILKFFEYLNSVGEGLIKSKAKPNESTADIDKKSLERKMGYGNRGMLLATPFNVPTQTLTAIWSGGKFEGADWMPLMLRRKKQ